VPVAERRRSAARKLDSLRKKGLDVQPVEIEGRKIARTFWGMAWCSHLESFSDYDNRLPRGRTYVRNGSVCHLAIDPGRVEARVAGSSLYTVRVQIKKLPPAKWRAIKQRSAGKIGSLLELLQGKLSDEVMRIVSDPQDGLFPLPAEIMFGCNCPDWADMCKHIAAVMYGIGARLDTSPELLFKLRGVDHEQLIAVGARAAVPAAAGSARSKRLAAGELSEVFGIELASDDQSSPKSDAAPVRKRASKARSKQTRQPAQPAASRKQRSSSQSPRARTTNARPKPKTVKAKKKK
jgi:uncharacterized Zn finger protein